MAGNWRFLEQGCSRPEGDALSVVGVSLRTQGPRSAGLPGYRSPLGYCLRLRKKGMRISTSTQGAGARAAGDQSAQATQPPRTTAPPRPTMPPRTQSLKVVPQLKGPPGSGLRLRPAQGRAAWSLAEPRPQKPRAFSVHSHFLHEWQVSTSTSLASVSAGDLRDEDLGSRSRLAEDFNIIPTSYLSFMSHVLKSEKPTKAVMRLIEKAVEVMKLERQIKEAQTQQQAVLEETRLLLDEKFCVQSDTKFIMDRLSNKTEQYRREIAKLWDNYAQESGAIQRSRQELTSKYAKQTSELQKQLLEKENKEFHLKQQLSTMKDISLVKEKQDTELQTLQEELKKVRAESTAKAYAQYLQVKALLEKQLTEPDLSLLGKRERKKLKKKAQALEVAAEKVAFECCSELLSKHKCLHKKLMQQSHRWQEMQATQSCLKNQKQQLQEEQWYIECLIRGRQRLQQGAPKTTKVLSRGTKSRLNPQ